MFSLSKSSIANLQVMGPVDKFDDVEFGTSIPYQSLDGVRGQPGAPVNQPEEFDISVGEHASCDDNDYVKRSFSISSTIFVLSWICLLLLKLGMVSTLDFQIALICAGGSFGVMLFLVTEGSPVEKFKVKSKLKRRIVTRGVFIASFFFFGLMFVPGILSLVGLSDFQRSCCESTFKKGLKPPTRQYLLFGRVFGDNKKPSL